MNVNSTLKDSICHTCSVCENLPCFNSSSSNFDNTVCNLALNKFILTLGEKKDILDIKWLPKIGINAVNGSLN